MNENENKIISRDELPKNAEVGTFFKPGIIHGLENAMAYVYYNPDAFCENGQFVVQELTAAQICVAHNLTEDAADSEDAFWNRLNDRCRIFLFDNDGLSSDFADILNVWDKGEVMTVDTLYKWALDIIKPEQDFTIKYTETFVHKFEVSARSPEEALEKFKANKGEYDFSDGCSVDTDAICVEASSDDKPMTNRNAVKAKLKEQVETQLEKVLERMDFEDVGSLPASVLDVQVSASAIIYDMMMEELIAGRLKYPVSPTGIDSWLQENCCNHDGKAGVAD